MATEAGSKVHPTAHPSVLLIGLVGGPKLTDVKLYADGLRGFRNGGAGTKFQVDPSQYRIFADAMLPVPVLVAFLLVLVAKEVLVTVEDSVNVAAFVEVVELVMVVVVTGILTSTSMLEVIVVLASVEGRESPTAQPSLGDSM
jgi:hypothetical protein